MKYIISEEQLNKVEENNEGVLGKVIRKIFEMSFPDFKDEMFIFYFEAGDSYYLIFPKTSLSPIFKQKLNKKLRSILDADITIFDKS